MLKKYLNLGLGRGREISRLYCWLEIDYGFFFAWDFYFCNDLLLHEYLCGSRAGDTPRNKIKSCQFYVEFHVSRGLANVDRIKARWLDPRQNILIYDYQLQFVNFVRDSGSWFLTIWFKLWSLWRIDWRHCIHDTFYFTPRETRQNLQIWERKQADDDCTLYIRVDIFSNFRPLSLIVSLFLD